MRSRRILVGVLVPNLSPTRDVAETCGKANLLQLRVLRLGLLDDGDVGVGVFVAILRIDRSVSDIALVSTVTVQIPRLISQEAFIIAKSVTERTQPK